MRCCTSDTEIVRGVGVQSGDSRDVRRARQDRHSAVCILKAVISAMNL